MRKLTYTLSGAAAGIGLFCLAAAGPLWAQGGPEAGGAGNAARAGVGNQISNHAAGIPEGAPGDNASFNDKSEDNSDAMQQAYKDYSQKKFAAAVPELQKILKKSPNELTAHQILANIYLQQNQLPQAIPEMEAIVRLSPKDAATRTNLGVAYLQTGSAPKAAETFQALATQYPTNSSYAFDYARALTAENKNADAAAAFDKAAALDPKNAQALLYAGLLYHQAGSDTKEHQASMDAKAVPDLKAALATGALSASDKFSADIALAEAASAAKQNSDAISDYTQATQANPTDFSAAANLGILQQNAGQKENAEAAYRQALTLKADNPKSYAAIQENLAGLLKSDGKLDEAATLLTQAAQVDSTSVALQDDLGSVYEKQGKKDQALAAYKQALTISPKNGLANEGVTRLSKP